MGDSGVQFAEIRYADVLVLNPSGRLDQDTSQIFQKQLLLLITQESLDRPRVILEMSGVDYVSSVGLRALMIVAKQCRAGNGQLALTNLSPVVSEIFEISRFNLIIDVFEDVRQAIMSISPDSVESYDANN